MGHGNCCNTSTTNTVSLSDTFEFLKGSSCSKRRTSFSTLMNLFLTSFVSPTFTENVTTPGDGFNLIIPSNSTNSWQIMNPTGALATGTITLPVFTDAVDGQEIIITTTLQIATITINKNGASNVYGVPGSMAAEDTFKLRYNKTTLSWYKVA